MPGGSYLSPQEVWSCWLLFAWNSHQSLCTLLNIQLWDNTFEARERDLTLRFQGECGSKLKAWHSFVTWLQRCLVVLLKDLSLFRSYSPVHFSVQMRLELEISWPTWAAGDFGHVNLNVYMAVLSKNFMLLELSLGISRLVTITSSRPYCPSVSVVEAEIITASATLGPTDSSPVSCLCSSTHLILIDSCCCPVTLFQNV